MSVLVGGKLAPAANCRRSGPQGLKPPLKWPKRHGSSRALPVKEFRFEDWSGDEQQIPPASLRSRVGMTRW